jgi:hypothetical protein
MTLFLVTTSALAANPKVENALKVLQDIGRHPAKMKTFCEMMVASLRPSSTSGSIPLRRNARLRCGPSPAAAGLFPGFLGECPSRVSGRTPRHHTPTILGMLHLAVFAKVRTDRFENKSMGPLSYFLQ